MRRSITSRVLLLVAVLTLGATGPSLAQRVTEQQGVQFITALGTQANQVLGDNRMSLEQREAQLRAILARNFDLAGIGRFVIGNAWRAANQDQQRAYLSVFAQYVTFTYARRLGGYRGQTFRVMEAKPVGKSDVIVTTEIQRPSGGPLVAGWRLRQRQGEIRIIDVLVSGVSMAVAQRSEFAAVVQKQGLDGLIEALRLQVNRFTAQS